MLDDVNLVNMLSWIRRIVLSRTAILGGVCFGAPRSGGYKWQYILISAFFKVLGGIVSVGIMSVDILSTPQFYRDGFPVRIVTHPSTNRSWCWLTCWINQLQRTTPRCSDITGFSPSYHYVTYDKVWPSQILTVCKTVAARRPSHWIPNNTDLWWLIIFTLSAPPRFRRIRIRIHWSYCSGHPIANHSRRDSNKPNGFSIMQSTGYLHK